MAEAVTDEKAARLAWSRTIVALLVVALVMTVPAVRAWAYPEIAEYVEVTDIYGNPLTAGEIDISVLQQGIYTINYPQRCKQLEDFDEPGIIGTGYGLQDDSRDGVQVSSPKFEEIQYTRNDEGGVVKERIFHELEALKPGR